MRRAALFCSVCVIGLALGTEGLAQQAPAAAQPVLEELVVTAQRREERLQDVPVSITALSEGRLEKSNITTTEKLTTMTPGLVFGRSNSFSQPTIRGVGSRNGSQGDESSVATYIDGVYRPEQFSNLFELYGVERIEVLKGPQGTLFGRNAAGGAISIFTKMPTRQFEGVVSGAVGDFNYRKASLYLSGPLGPALSANLSATGLKDDGFVDNIFLHQKTGSHDLGAARGKLLWNVDDSTDLWLGLSGSNYLDNTNQSAQPLNGNTRGRQVNPNVLYATQPWTTSTQFPVFSKTKGFGADLHLDKTFDGVALKAVAAYTRSKQHNLTDADNTPVSFSSNDTSFESNSYSFETVLTSTGERRLNWTLGANAFRNDATLDPFISGAVNFRGDQHTHAASIFGEAVYEVVDNLFVTAGARYSWEKRRAFYFQRSPTVVTANGEGTWRDLSPRFVVRYQYAPNSNVYASYSRGFKSGTFNASSAQGSTTPADPEHIDAFEVGMKSDLTSRARINVAAFYYKYDNLQVTVPLFINNATVFALSNAAKSISYGLEGNGDFVLTDSLRARAGLSLLHATYDEFANAAVVAPSPAFITNGTPAGNATVVRDVTGNDLSRSPRWTWNLGLDYDHELFDGEFGLSVDAYSSAKWYSEPLNRLSQPSYTQLNASARWTAPGDHWTFMLSGENLTDAKVYSQLFTSAVGDFIAYQRPRFVSFKVEYRY